jgi:hypothetical protein
MMSFLKEVFKTGLRMRKTTVVDDDFPEMMHYFDSALNTVERLLPTPNIICLCGSTKFRKAFLKANKELTHQGNIVLTVGSLPDDRDIKSSEDIFGEEIKMKLDELHKRKIDLADEIFVLNVGGYIGSSTRSEIDYALNTGKPVKYLEPRS